MVSKRYIQYIKYICFTFLFLSSFNAVFAQMNNAGINFQAVARDKELNAANNRKVYVKCTIENGLTNPIIVYGENHNVYTNEFGIFNLIIGKGVRYVGVKDIFAIDWLKGNYFFHLKISITPIAPDVNWDYNKEWIDLGAVEFGVVPYAIQSLSSNAAGIDTATLNTKLNITDTARMLLPYHKAIFIGDSLKYVTPYQLALKTVDTSSLSNRINLKLSQSDTLYLSKRIDAKISIADSTTYVTPYQLTLQKNQTTNISNSMNLKLNISDTAAMLNNRFARDTFFLSNRINLKEDIANKSVDVSLVGDYNDIKYPSVKAIKTYVDAALIAGAPDATTINKGILMLNGDLTGTAISPVIAINAISTNKIQDAAVTDAKLANGISASKVGLGNVSNHAQLYSLNGLNAQVQNFSIPGIIGLSPNWISVGATHTLNIPLASASSVTAGLISKTDYDHFNTSYTNTINSLTTLGNNGSATLTSNILNIPTYSLIGLAGNVNANTVFAGPSSGAASAAGFRSLVSLDIPNNGANTSGNAATASKLLTARNINDVLFDGTANITIQANTTNPLNFISTGLGLNAGSSFNGANSTDISYNSIGAAPTIGSTSITTLGFITTGTWAANIIGANYGGAGTNNGILRANGLGVVSVASAGTDFQTPLSFSSPLVNTSNTISIPQANGFNSGYLSNGDWTLFNNKIDLTEKGIQNGVATLDVNGKIPASQIPSISFSSGYVVTSQAAMLGLSAAVVGSIAIRTDNSKNYVLSGLPASTLSNWLELLMPAAISSVNGHTESSFTLITTEIPEGTNLYYTTTRARNAISANSPLTYSASTGIVSIPAASTSVSGYLTTADWNVFNNKIGAFGAQSANTFYAGPSSGVNATPTFRTIVVGDVPTLNQNTTGNAATATKLAATKTINGVPFDGSANITIYSNVPSPITFDDSGLGGITTTTFNGSVAKTISYNTIGAAPAVGSTAIITLGSITTGTWLGSVIDANHGGAGNVNGVLKANGSGVVSAATAGIDFENAITFNSPLSRTSNAVSMTAATTSSSGYLTSTDWNLFNSKQSSVVAGLGVTVSGGNTVSIGQSVATTASPTFSTITLSGLNVAGLVTNTAGGVLSTTTTTGTGSIVRSISPTLVTPILGDATATSINAGTISSTSIMVSGDVTAKRFKLTMPNAITAASTTNIDLSGGNVFTVNMGLNITTLNLTNPVVGTYLIKFVQDATGTRDVTFPVAWKWAGGVSPSLTNTANKIDIVTLIYDGATYYTTIVQNF